jgi:methionyl-tRNA formyltransferase
VLVLCPNPYSLLSLSVLAILDRLGIVPVALVVRTFNIKRVLQEYRRDGPALLYKVWRKLILRGDENPQRVSTALDTFVTAFANGSNNAAEFARKRGVRVFKVADFNEPDCLRALASVKADIGLFTGGGMIGKDAQAQFSIGIVNPHAGHLPHYRGMDVVEWPLLNGAKHNFGLTAHIMDPGLDTGPIIQHTRVDATPYDSIGALRNAIAGLAPVLLVDSYLGLGSGRLRPIDQGAEPQRLMYYVHRDLWALLNPILQRQVVPGASPVDSISRFHDFHEELRSGE